MSVDYQDIGQRIKGLRMEKGLTQEQLSERIGVGPSHMSPHRVRLHRAQPCGFYFHSECPGLLCRCTSLSGNPGWKAAYEQLAVRNRG